MLSILKSALNANTKEMGIVSNNIANVNSTAFKKSKTNFIIYNIDNLFLIQTACTYEQLNHLNKFQSIYHF